MKSRKIAGGYLIRLERGEEAVESLASFTAEKKILCGVFQGIGAIDNLELGYFDTGARQYRRRCLKKQVEVLSLIGNISYLNKKPFIHAHITVADADQMVLGGHFFRGNVAVTLEIYIKVITGRLKRFHDPKMGFNFWDL